MCGFAGLIADRIADHAALRRSLSCMGDRIAHRGPDSEGIWCDVAAGIGIVHRRLAILDLSPAGNQPMVSTSGRFVLAFNGEIYNHQELRKQLIGFEWGGHSDTETLLAGFELWGVERTLKKCVGMFAIALWNREQRYLVLARDRFGEKPLYYGWQNGAFLFGSELKALRTYQAFAGEINRDALTLLMRHNCVPGPYSIYKNIFKLPPGTWLRIDPSLGAFAAGQPVPYWSLRQVASQGQNSPYGGSDSDAVSALDTLLRDAVRQQMMADVPLGAFLSGGVDSSTIVALMQAQSDRPVKTFTIGLHEQGYNEAEYAKAVAQHLGTEHTELYVSPQQALEVIPSLPVLYDEPFSDSSQIPMFLVSKMTRQHVTVSLSGDAGDEVFGGYNRYLMVSGIWRKLSVLPMGVRRSMACALLAASPAAWNRWYGLIASLLPAKARFTQPGDKMHKLAEILGAASVEEIYRGVVSHWKNPTDIVIGANEPPTALTLTDAWSAVDGLEHRMMVLDAISYLPNDILVKLDRAAMGVSLETRVPMLDHRVVEFAWRLPLSMKIRNGQSKWILRQVLYKYVPKVLIDRPKMGFGVPIDSWLRGPLREWAESLLAEDRLKREGYFHPGPIRQKWTEHLSGKRNWQYHLWDVLMFQAWLEEQRV